MTLPTSTLRRRGGIVAACVVGVGINAALGGEAIHRLPYVLAALAVLVLLQTFWEERSTSGRWLAVSSATMIIALLASITLSVGRSEREQTERASAAPTTTEEPADASTTTLLTGTDVPAEVQGAVESRDDAQQLVTCESALEQIAAAIRQAGGTLDTPVAAPANGIGEPDVGRRLQSCNVRLRAIAATLPG